MMIMLCNQFQDTLDEINDSINIDGGDGFDWLIIELLQKK